MDGKRIARAVFAVIFLGFFIFYTYRQEGIHWHTDSVYEAGFGPATKLKPEGFDSDYSIPDTNPVPTQTESADLSETPAIQNEPTPVPMLDPNSPEARAAVLGLPAPPMVDINSWEFLLANADNSIAEYEPPELVSVEEQKVDSRIAEALSAMAADTRAQNLSVYLSSGYRSYSDQQANFTRVCNNNGVSDGKNSEGFYITMPAGCSEHQTGLCCDITDRYYELKDSSLENTEMFKYMSKHCHEFGFILRFPDGMQNITGVMYEPFHFRYVGVEAATYIMENKLCLEQFLDLYKA